MKKRYFAALTALGLTAASLVSHAALPDSFFCTGWKNSSNGGAIGGGLLVLQWHKKSQLMNFYEPVDYMTINNQVKRHGRISISDVTVALPPMKIEDIEFGREYHAEGTGFDGRAYHLSLRFREPGEVRGEKPDYVAQGEYHLEKGTWQASSSEKGHLFCLTSRQ